MTDQATVAAGDAVHGSPRTPGSPREKFLLPTGSPVPTRRHRTYSMNERVRVAPTYKGTVKEFCRQQGHGFITPVSDEDKTDLFVHISDIDGAYVPKEGDEVFYKKILVPPKNAMYMAVGVKITHLKEGISHERWEDVKSKGTPAC